WRFRCFSIGTGTGATEGQEGCEKGRQEGCEEGRQDGSEERRQERREEGRFEDRSVSGERRLAIPRHRTRRQDGRDWRARLREERRLPRCNRSAQNDSRQGEGDRSDEGLGSVASRKVEDVHR